MYEQFRNDIISMLHDTLDSNQITAVLNAIDTVSNGYNIEKRSTDLAVVGRRDLLDTIKLYFIIKSQEGMSATSIKTERYILEAFAMHITVPMANITSNMIRSYLYNYQLEHGTSQRTMETYRTVICTFCKWMHVEGYIPADITSVIKRIHYAKKPRKALSQIQLEDVRSACKTPLEHALVQFLYSTGCRISELVNLRQSDIDWSRRQATVTGKGNKTRTVYINAKAEKAVKQYLISSGNSGGEWLMLNRRNTGRITKECAQRIFRDLRDRLGLGRGELVPHTMRHTMATQAATLCPIQQVQAMLGHATINTTMVYAQTSSDQVKAGHKLSVI